VGGVAKLESKSSGELSLLCVHGGAGDGCGHVGPMIGIAFKFSDSLQGFLSQGSPFTSDGEFSHPLDMRHATVKRGDELVQMTNRVGSIRLGHTTTVAETADVPCAI
jgi:hypothetical protein